MKPALQILVRRLRDLFAVARSKVSALLRKPGDGASTRAESVIVYEPARTRDWLEEKLRERESELAALKKDVQELQAKIAAAIRDEKERSRKEIAALNATHARVLAAKNSALETAKAKFSARLLDERALSNKARDAQRASLAEELARREASYADEIARLRRELDEARRKGILRQDDRRRTCPLEACPLGLRENL